jgi:hypothetical protein
MKELEQIPLVVSTEKAWLEKAWLEPNGMATPDAPVAQSHVETERPRLGRLNVLPRMMDGLTAQGPLRRRMLVGLAACALCAVGLTVALSGSNVSSSTDAPLSSESHMESVAAHELDPAGPESPGAATVQALRSSMQSSTDPRDFVLVQLRAGVFGEDLAGARSPEAIVDSRNGDIVLVRVIERPSEQNTTEETNLFSVLLVRSAESWDVRETYRT